MCSAPGHSGARWLPLPPRSSTLLIHLTHAAHALVTVIFWRASAVGVFVGRRFETWFNSSGNLAAWGSVAKAARRNMSYIPASMPSTWAGAAGPGRRAISTRGRHFQSPSGSEQ